MLLLLALAVGKAMRVSHTTNHTHSADEKITRFSSLSLELTFSLCLLFVSPIEWNNGRSIYFNCSRPVGSP